MKDSIDLFELLSAKLFHDLAGTVGVIVNSIEFLMDDDEIMKKEEISMLIESSDDIMNKFKLLRQAYSYSDNNMYFQETKCNLQTYLKKNQLFLEWNIDNLYSNNTEHTEIVNKLIVNVVILFISLMINGSSVSIYIKMEQDSTQVLVQGNSYKIEINKEIDSIFLNKKIELTTKNVHAYFVHLLLKRYKIEIVSYSTIESKIEMQMRFPWQL